ncbi:hypothetical protein D3C81_1284110 [compost metagenome]
MRVAGQHEGVDAEFGVLAHALGDGVRIAHQRGARAAAHQADAGPQVGADFQRLARAARAALSARMQRGHAALPFRIHPGEHRLRARHGLVVEAADQVFGGGPRGGIGLAHDHVQADAEPDRAAVLRRVPAHVFQLLRHVRRRLAPGQVGIDLLARQRMRRRRRAAEIHRRMRPLQRRVEDARVLHAQVLALVVDLAAVMAGRQHVAPDAQEFCRGLVALAVIEEQAIAFQLGGVAAGDQVDQQPAVGEAIEGCRHARRQCRRHQARPHRDQEFQALRHGRQRRCRHPWVFARAAGGNQHPFIAERIGGHGDLLHIVEIDFARAFGGAEVAAVAVGGDKPEYVHVVSLLLCEA